MSGERAEAHDGPPAPPCRDRDGSARKDRRKCYRDKIKLNPENLFVATVASAHMLSWLHVAFQMGIEVETYRDPASGVLTEISEGVYWVSEVILKPTITFAGRQELMPNAITRIHELANEQCFIANSIKTKVTVRSP